MSTIAVVGAGYVGLTTAVCLADIGNQVTGVDIDASKIGALRRGEPTFHEPGVFPKQACPAVGDTEEYSHMSNTACPPASPT